MDQPWIDHQDLRYKGTSCTNKDHEVYQWRDTDMIVVIDMNTMEIVDIREGL